MSSNPDLVAELFLRMWRYELRPDADGIRQWLKEQYPAQHESDLWHGFRTACDLHSVVLATGGEVSDAPDDILHERVAQYLNVTGPKGLSDLALGLAREAAIEMVRLKIQ